MNSSLVDQARNVWTRRLIEHSRSNNLLYFRELKTGTLDVSGYDPAALTDLLAGKPVALTKLAPSARTDETAAVARVNEIRRRAMENLEEKGLETLFLAIGMATWTAEEGGRAPTAPIILVPLTLSARSRDAASARIQRAGDVQLNLVLLYFLEDEYGLKIPQEPLMEDLTARDDDDTTFDIEAVFARLAREAARLKDFTVSRKAVLANFSFQKMAMVRDIRECGAALAADPLIAAIAGDVEARKKVRGDPAEIDPQTFDGVQPDDEFMILDADSSQQAVIAAALKEKNGVIWGPPGTGKSQTIANLISEHVARGKRVLFVAEKRAALEAVYKRMDKAGLGHLILDLHGGDVSKRSIMERLKYALAKLREAAPADTAATHKRFTECRRRLVDHLRRLHSKRVPAGKSVYELQGDLLRIPPESHSETRWRGPDLDKLDAPSFARVRDLLVEAQGFGELAMRTDPSPWTGANLPDGESAQRAVDAVQRLLSGRWHSMMADARALSTAMSPDPSPPLDGQPSNGPRTSTVGPKTVNEIRDALRLLAGMRQTIALYSSDLFSLDLQAVSAALAPASKGAFSALFAWITNKPFRVARRQLRAMRRAGPAPASVLRAEAATAADQQARWSRRSARRVPVIPDNLDDMTARYEKARADLEILAVTVRVSLPILPADSRDDADLFGKPFEQVDSRLKALSADAATAFRIPGLMAIERQIGDAGAGPILDEIRRRKVESKLWPELFDHAWRRSNLERAYAEDPELAGFRGMTHEQFVREFIRLDRERLKLAADRIRRSHAEHAVRVMNDHPDEESLVRHESSKSRRHLPFRKLAAQASNVLTAVCPCWMASPLSVSQLLDASKKYFDIVIFDEASQILPEDAVPSIHRGRQVVVAGDPKQLPPTLFFIGSDEDSEEESANMTEGFESLLDQMLSYLDPWPLEWHYRSLDERLIAFSNHHIYADRLVTFPGCGAFPAVSHVLAPFVSAGADENADSAGAEVMRVAELVLQHAEERPNETLGVIAMSIVHARRLDLAIRKTLQDRPDLTAFFDESRPLDERFFVKNLERVQGDERDAIIISTGYAKDRAGRLPHRFGPLLMKGGERRLNVAVTRARKRLTLVTSFDHTDIDLSRSGAEGVKLLKFYIEYASTGGRRLGEGTATAVPLNAFEVDVYETLKANGISLIPQFGVSRYRLDFAVQHPDNPGRYVLAVECDGASYHSGATARDRDRLRQQHLEALGWKFHRIWSTDWFTRKDQEVARFLDVCRQAIKSASPGERASESAPAAVAVPAADKQSGRPRKARPGIPFRESISDYTPQELDKLVDWIQSDARNRTDAEILRELIPALGFDRRGPRIEEACMAAITRRRSH